MYKPSITVEFHLNNNNDIVSLQIPKKIKNKNLEVFIFYFPHNRVLGYVKFMQVLVF